MTLHTHLSWKTPFKSLGDIFFKISHLVYISKTLLRNSMPILNAAFQNVKKILFPLEFPLIEQFCFLYSSHKVIASPSASSITTL